MRNYKYIWKKSANEVLISGLEFHEVKCIFEGQELLLLKHKCENASFDSESRFYFIRIKDISESQKEIYSWGDFAFMNCPIDEKRMFSKDTIKSILYFSHTGTFEQELCNNGILGGCYIHDDGWYFSYSGSKDTVDKIIKVATGSSNDNIMIEEGRAVLLYGNKHCEAPATNDIDYVLNNALRKFKSAQQGDAHGAHDSAFPNGRRL